MPCPLVFGATGTSGCTQCGALGGGGPGFGGRGGTTGGRIGKPESATKWGRLGPARVPRDGEPSGCWLGSDGGGDVSSFPEFAIGKNRLPSNSSRLTCRFES